MKKVNCNTHTCYLACMVTLACKYNIYNRISPPAKFTKKDDKQKKDFINTKGNLKGNVFVDISESLLKDHVFCELFFQMFSKHVPQSRQAMFNFVQDVHPQIERLLLDPRFNKIAFNQGNVDTGFVFKTHGGKMSQISQLKKQTAIDLLKSKYSRPSYYMLHRFCEDKLSDKSLKVDSCYAPLTIMKRFKFKQKQNSEKAKADVHHSSMNDYYSDRLIEAEFFLNDDKYKTNPSLEELLTNNEKILIIGEAGVGKTTWCKRIAYLWSTSCLPDSSFPNNQDFLIIR